MSASSDSQPVTPSGRYDAAARRRSRRSGRERGCWLYVPAEVLAEAGIDPHAERPWYRVWATPRGGLFGRLYTAP
jgi:hypothetical protein